VLDLKAKLAAAGLVSKADIERAEAARKGKAGKGKRPSGGPSEPRTPQLPVASLQGKPKGEIYEVVRRWIEQIRIDGSAAAPSDEAKAFHFSTAAGKIGRLVLEPDIAAQLEDGRAGLVSYMSNHGLAHAVVPAPAAQQLVQVMPLWLRVLAGDERAGLTEEKAETAKP